MRKIMILTKGLLCQEIKSVRVLMGYLLGLTLLAMWVNDFLGYAGELGEPVNLWEAFVVAAHQDVPARCLVLGYLLVIADAPFVRGNTYITLYRSGRRVWNLGMLLYILCQAFLYPLSLAAFCTAVSAPYGFWGRIWSSPAYVLAADAAKALAGRYHLVFDGMAMMKYMTAPQAFGMTFLYLFCYLAFIGILLYVCNLVLGGFWGLVAVAAVHLGGAALSFLARLPQTPAGYVDGAGGHWRYPFVFLALSFLMAAVSLAAVRRVDIRAKSKGGA